VVDLLRGVYSKQYRAVHIIDLRYEYEFDGGHVAGAINFPSQSADAKLQQFFTEHRSVGRDSVVVMYCEFSSERGPRALKRLRKFDRDSNISRYPHLDFPYVYLLEGGYSQFFAEQRHHCHPQAYVRMDDPAHRLACVQARSSQRVNKRLSSGVGIIGRALSGNIFPSRPDTSSCPLP
jgi:M-phase inducer tyrosine phosphatase